jgi:protein required for attachment to host cells
MLTRVVIADQSEARFYDVERVGAPFRLVARLTDSMARLHDRDLKSDRLGRVVDHAASSGQRHGAVVHHAPAGEDSPRKQEAHRFAEHIAQELETARREDRFERLVLIAGPAFLGMLRAALPKAVSAAVAHEVPKDFVHESEEAMHAHLSKYAFGPTD